MSVTSSDTHSIESDITNEGQNKRNPPPISPVIIIKTKNSKTYRKPKDSSRRVHFLAEVWPKTKWFSEELDRESAESVVRGAENGTFLIRKSSESGCYAMTIAYNQRIYHCLIQKFSNGYGFDSHRIFPTIEELVSHYKNFESLAFHNRVLSTRLLIPAFSPTIP